MNSISIIFTAACLAMYLLLSMNAAMTRRRSGLAVGEKDNETLARAVKIMEIEFIDNNCTKIV